MLLRVYSVQGGGGVKWTNYITMTSLLSLNTTILLILDLCDGVGSE